jgi:predicted nucleic acid-binding protein
MKFWDSSAIMPLCLKEATSEILRQIAEDDEEITVWWATPIECISALARRKREGKFPAEAERDSRKILSQLAAEWSEVLPTPLVRQRAERLIGIHPLRAADAFQLGAALIWAEENPPGLAFVCLDRNLREAARKEGFTILP